MTDLHSITKLNCRHLPSGIGSRVARRFAAEIPGLIAHLDAAQPLDRHVAFPAGDEHAQRIALLGPQHLAVLGVDDQHVVHDLLERNRARVARAVGAFERDPLGAGLQARLVEQPGSRDARPLRAGQQPVRLLHGRRGRLGQSVSLLPEHSRK